MTRDRLIGMVFETDQSVFLLKNDQTMTKRSVETRGLLLATASAILKEGEEVLTLDAVVKRSGISKGGLIHHFPSKEALVEGIVDDLIRQFAIASQQTNAASEAEIPPGAKSYVEGSLDPACRRAAADLARGLIRLYGADFRKDTPFLDPWRKLFTSRLARFRQQGDLEGFAKHAVVTLAIECFVLIDVFNLVEFSEQETEAIKHELIHRLST